MYAPPKNSTSSAMNSATSVPTALSCSMRDGTASTLWVTSKPTIVTGHSASKTIAAASGSARMLNSADGVMLPVWCPPPISVTPATRETSSG